MYLEVSPNWEWVGSLLTVGTNVKIRGLASESPEETFQLTWKQPAGRSSVREVTGHIPRAADPVSLWKYCLLCN